MLPFSHVPKNFMLLLLAYTKKRLFKRITFSLRGTVIVKYLHGHNFNIQYFPHVFPSDSFNMHRSAKVAVDSVVAFLLLGGPVFHICPDINFPHFRRNIAG
jgi:hypothetical protein